MFKVAAFSWSVRAGFAQVLRSRFLGLAPTVLFTLVVVMVRLICCCWFFASLSLIVFSFSLVATAGGLAGSGRAGAMRSISSKRIKSCSHPLYQGMNRLCITSLTSSNHGWFRRNLEAVLFAGDGARSWQIRSNPRSSTNLSLCLRVPGDHWG